MLPVVIKCIESICGIFPISEQGSQQDKGDNECERKSVFNLLLIDIL